MGRHGVEGWKYGTTSFWCQTFRCTTQLFCSARKTKLVKNFATKICPPGCPESPPWISGLRLCPAKSLLPSAVANSPRTPLMCLQESASAWQEQIRFRQSWYLVKTGTSGNPSGASCETCPRPPARRIWSCSITAFSNSLPILPCSSSGAVANAASSQST